LANDCLIGWIDDIKHFTFRFNELVVDKEFAFDEVELLFELHFFIQIYKCVSRKKIWFIWLKYYWIVDL
jgi:hypothetical protein